MAEVTGLSEKPSSNSKLSSAEQRVDANPFDLDAWAILIKDAQNRRIEDARPIFEKLVTQFPSCGKFWKIYIEQEMKSRNYDCVEKLFQRCLMQVLNIDLWKCYLNYIKETKGKLPSFKEKMAQAFDFAMDKMGLDLMSFPIWNDYVTFLKSVEAVGQYAENQRITAVRKVYQRGINVPMINIEQLWSDYNKYEQVEAWKKYIAWEKGNPLRTEDPALLAKRVMFAYEQCLLSLGYHPDVWCEAANYLEKSSRELADRGDKTAGEMFQKETSALYERAVNSFMKSNMLIYFAYADFEESCKHVEKTHSIYKKLIAITEVDPTLGYVQYMKFCRRTEGIKTARNVFRMAREDSRSQHQAFIAAAWMEYFCSKEKQVALKIYELGFKKFGGIPEYMNSFLDFMAHVNEDNNTRVLFERVLTSDAIPADRILEVWSRFLEFECIVGDLENIVAVEKRRRIVLEKQVGEYADRETALLIDRYKFMDLYPCTDSELKSLGYKPVGTRGTQHTVSTNNTTDEPKSKYPQPDFSQMLPFKPQRGSNYGTHPVPGGVFPYPPAAASLLKRLPPPGSFHGPFVAVDAFLEQFLLCDLPDAPDFEPRRISVLNGDLIDLNSKSIKRKLTDEDEDLRMQPSQVDIYRQRLQKRAK